MGYSGARILVIDSERRVRAETGTIQTESESESDTAGVDRLAKLFAAVRPWIHAAVFGERYKNENTEAEDEESAASQAIGASLAGEPIAMRSRLGKDGEIILAAHPIISAESVIGTVIVEQNISDILAFQRTAFEQVILVSSLSLFAVFVSLLAFAGRLAWRIRNLRPRSKLSDRFVRAPAHQYTDS